MVLTSNENFIIIITVLLFVCYLVANFFVQINFCFKEILKKWCQEPWFPASSKKNWLIQWFLELNGSLILLKFLVYTILYFKLTKQKESSGVYWLFKLIYKHLELTLYWIIGKYLVQFRIFLTNKNRCNILRNSFISQIN